MPLTVEVDGTNPNRVNVTGDGFAFTTALSGNRVDITGVGRTVAATFADPQADIQWSGGEILLCSSHYNPSGQFLEFPIRLPYSSPATLGDATALSEVYSYAESSTSTTNIIQDLGMAGNYLFLCSNNGAVHKIDVTTGIVAGSITTELTNIVFSVIDENIVYVKAMDGSNVYLLRLDFTISEFETVETWSRTDTYNGDSISYGSTYWMILAKYGLKTYLISADYWTGYDKADVTQTMVYDVTGETLIDDPYNYVTSGDYISDIDGSSNRVTAPSMYQSKVAFTWCCTNIDWDNETQAPYMTIIVDIENDTVTKISKTISGYEGEPAVYRNSGCDQDTGIYYVWVYGYDSGGNAILALNLNNTVPFYQVSVSDDSEVEIMQGDVDCYAGEYLTMTTQDIKGPLPSMVTLKGGAVRKLPTFVDTSENMAWVQSAADTLTGNNMSGGVNRTISLNYDGAIYDYPTDRTFYPLMIFNNTFVTHIVSRSLTTWQREIRVFREV